MNTDDVLSDACDLLDDLETCKDKCADHDATKKLLERACKLKDERIERETNPEDWITIGDASFKKLDKEDYKIIIFGVAIFLPMAILYTFIHESGHAIVALIFGWDIVDFQISFFPFILDSLGGYVMISIPGMPMDWQLIAMYGAGSLFTLIVAYVLFFLFYNFKLNKYAELALVVYMAVLALDSIAYIFRDMFFGGTGDWYQCYSLSPVFVCIVLALCILNIVLFVANFKKIVREVDID